MAKRFRSWSTLSHSVGSVLIAFFCCLGGICTAEENKSSLYSVPLKWTDESGHKVKLSQWAERFVVITMAYTTCKSSCPLTFKRLKEIESSLEKQGAHAEFVVVSFDPVRDTPTQMAHFKMMHKLEGEHWHLLAGTEDAIRTLSVLLGISYQRDPASGEYVHSNKIALLDTAGAIVVNLEGLASDTQPLVEAVVKAGAERIATSARPN